MFASGSIMSIALLLLMAMTASADSKQGDRFITELDGNTLSGTGSSGLAFNIYFLAGGFVTYTNVTGQRVHGRWHLARNGDVCVYWQHPVDTMEGCVHLSIDGEKVNWKGANGSGRALLRGNVADTFLHDRQ